MSGGKDTGLMKGLYRLAVPGAVRRRLTPALTGALMSCGLVEPDWLTRTGKQMRGLGRLLPGEGFVSEGGRKRILSYAMIPWPQGAVQHMLVTALRLRGHEAVTAVCAGPLPACEMHYYDMDRPVCGRCHEKAARFGKAFGLTTQATSDLVGGKDLADALDAVAGLDEEGLTSLVFEGVPVGELARFQVNVFYQNFLVELDGAQVEQLRSLCGTGIILTRHAGRLLDEARPDIVMTVNGKGITFGTMFAAARRRGIRVVTWEEHAFDDTMKFVFSHDSYAGEIHLERAWEDERDRALTPEEDARLDDYFARWRRSEITPFPYYTGRDTAPSGREAGAPAGGPPLIACFPNMCRDTTAINRDIAFRNLISWLVETVEFAKSRPDLSFAVRAHPAERCLPEQYAKYNRLFVCDEIRKRFDPLPPNVALYEGDSPVSSYELLDRADVIMVYSSTMGLECALNGRLACVVGDVHYRGKGFTKDVDAADELWAFIGGGPPYERSITPEQVEFARRYANMWRFRHPVKMPYYDDGTRQLRLPDLRVLMPGGDPVIDRLCGRILDGGPFIDING